MSIEDELFHAFKYAGFAQKIDPTIMIRTLLRNLEISMLSQMEASIRMRLSELQGINQNSDSSTGSTDSMDPFIILGVEIDATREEVTKAYREKAKNFHPDKGGNNEDMVKINAAYETIRIFKGWKERQ